MILWFFFLLYFNNSKIIIIFLYWILLQFQPVWKMFRKLENKNLKHIGMGFWNNKKQFGKSCFTIRVCWGRMEDTFFLCCSYLNFVLLSVEKPRDGKFIVHKSNGKVKWKVLSVCVCVCVCLAIKATDFQCFSQFGHVFLIVITHVLKSISGSVVEIDGMFWMQEL